nr:MAG TPA: Putative double-strand recombination repair-like [Caudoviricetes sp.]DAQ17099.1 MAG TPA: Putative double-strand recombination repair-like [Caudoviricetes sp.]
MKTFYKIADKPRSTIPVSRRYGDCFLDPFKRPAATAQAE